MIEEGKATPGMGVDPGLVERVKLLRENGTHWKAIAKQCDISISTAQRYYTRPDETPEQEEERNEERKKCIRDIYSIVHKAAAALLIALERGELKPKELATLWGIGVDKIPQMEALMGRQRGGDKGGPVLQLNFINANQSECRPIANPTELPHVINAIPGDDMRLGSGENLLRLPGGSEAEPGEED